MAVKSTEKSTWLNETFPNSKRAFAPPPSAFDVKDTALIVLDSSALLLPYELEKLALPGIIEVYKKLSEQSRLIVPAQAAREFTKNRPRVMATMVQAIRDAAAHAGPALKKVGALIGHDEYEKVNEASISLAKQTQELRDAIIKLADSIAGSVGRDPVSLAYNEILSGTVHSDPEDCLDFNAFQNDMKLRYERKRPPGYKDQKKPDGGIGDLVIWKSIIELGRQKSKPCIFVTSDVKEDWVVKVGGSLLPRPELTEEYYDACGNSFHIVHLSKILEMFEIDSDAINEVRDAEGDREIERRWLEISTILDTDSLGKYYNAVVDHFLRGPCEDRNGLINAIYYNINSLDAAHTSSGKISRGSFVYHPLYEHGFVVGADEDYAQVAFHSVGAILNIRIDQLKLVDIKNGKFISK